MADKEKGNNPLPVSLSSPSPPAHFSDEKTSPALVFLERMINIRIARTFSLSTGKNGYGETAHWPHPNEGRVALRTGIHGNLLWP